MCWGVNESQRLATEDQIRELQPGVAQPSCAGGLHGFSGEAPRPIFVAPIALVFERRARRG